MENALGVNNLVALISKSQISFEVQFDYRHRHFH